MKNRIAFFLAIFLLCLVFLPASYAEEYRWPSYKGVYQFTENSKVGLKNIAGDILLECEYDSISYWFQDGFAIVKKDGDWGYINQQWQLVLPPVPNQTLIDYESEGITTFNHYSFGPFEETCGFLDLTTGDVFFLPYERIGWCQEGLIKVRQNDLFGFVDKTGKLVIDCRWLGAADFSEGKALVKDEEGFLFIDKAGNLLFGNHWADALPFSGGCAPVCNGTLWGLIDAGGNMLTDYLFDEIKSFGSLVFVKKGELWGMLDSKGNVLFEPQWDEVCPSHLWEEEAKIFPVVKNGLYGYVNQEGRLIQEPRWADDATYGSFVEYVVAEDEKGIYHLIDYEGNMLFSTKYRIQEISENLVYVQKGWIGNYGILDMQGNEVAPCIYSNMLQFSEGLCAVEKNGKWGYINSTGDVVIPFQFDIALEFVDGVAWVTIGETQCMIDREGQLLSGLIVLPEVSDIPDDYTLAPLQDLQDDFDSLKKMQDDPS